MPRGVRSGHRARLAIRPDDADVELRFFGGLSQDEAAEALQISIATLKRDWDFAKAWLTRQFS